MCQRVAIRTEGLVKAMGTRTVLRGANLAIIEGECIVLRGDNGSGKTTLLRCLAGLLRPDTGDVRWFERAPWETTARRLIGMLAHDSHLYPHLTLRENLILAGRLHDLDKPAQRASLWLEAAGLKQHEDRLPREVSQGMQRRASLARALVHEPLILLLDEPYSSLDQTGREWLGDVLFQRRNQGRTTCLVTHEVPPTSQLANRILELRSGRLWEWQGSKSEQGRDSDVPARVLPGAFLEQVAA
jgi:ABC-type multidrug transport system ATPase subunit